MTATNPWNAARFKTVRITDAYMTATNPWNAARFKTVRITDDISTAASFPCAPLRQYT
jgi:hypothetical protein